MGYRILCGCARPFKSARSVQEVNRVIRGVKPVGRPVLEFGEEKAKQEFQKDCDINVIMARYRITGQLDIFNAREARYGDFADVGDFQSCMQRVKEAQDSFESLPSEIRNHFRNDPAELIAACHDENRVEELRNLGLIPLGEKSPIAAVAAVADGGEKPPVAPGGASD